MILYRPESRRQKDFLTVIRIYARMSHGIEDTNHEHLPRVTMTGLTARNLFAAFLLPFVVVFSVGSLSAAGVASEISPARHIGW